MIEMKRLTVKDLKKALEGVPDNLEVVLSSDTGVDQSDYDGEIIVEDAYRNHYKLPEGQKFDDTGDNEVDEFVIYVNDRDLEDDEEE
jgi:hypothetical protein